MIFLGGVQVFLLGVENESSWIGMSISDPISFGLCMKKWAKRIRRSKSCQSVKFEMGEGEAGDGQNDRPLLSKVMVEGAIVSLPRCTTWFFISER